VIAISEEKSVIEDVPFINIEYARVFKGCEGRSKEEIKLVLTKK
jgi:hypothetical protein